MMAKYRRKHLKSAEKKKKQRHILIVFGIILLVIMLGAYLYSSGQKASSHNRIAVIETSMGAIEFELYEDEAPITAGNFIELSKRGFYDGLIFHRVIKGFMIQGGDPTGTGTGGSGKTIPDEIVPELKHDSIGILSMANSGPDTGSSQFFITLAPATHLDGKHSVFGKMVKGQDVLLSIGSVPVDAQDRPLTKVTMKIIIKD